MTSDTGETTNNMADAVGRGGENGGGGGDREDSSARNNRSAENLDTGVGEATAAVEDETETEEALSSSGGRPPPSSVEPPLPRGANTVARLVTHLLLILVYFIPLTKHHPHHETVLDEMHILLEENDDVNGRSTLSEVFTNDYWGRPMTKADSHKSWRPVSVLTFRYLRQWGHGDWWYGMPRINPILVARLVTVVIHAALAELVSITACLLFPSSSPRTTLLLLAVSKLLFGFHPAHVECVANAANRPHVLAVICSMVALDYRNHVLLCVAAMLGGLMSCETMIFQVPAVLVTMTVIRWKNGYDRDDRGDGEGKKSKSVSSSLGAVVCSLLPRYFVVVALSLCYLIGRFAFGTTDIPEGLMRRAENPFYDFVGKRRVLNYALVLSIHVGKSFFIDPIGFSHEYGFNCVPEVEGGLSDRRLLVPAGIAIMLVFLTIWCVRRGLTHCLDLLVALSWMATLFPVSGLIKVGTFVADRIVIASTVVVAVFGGKILAGWLLLGCDKNSNSAAIFCASRAFSVLRFLIVLGGMSVLWSRVLRRSSEWMTSPDLLESSLRSCPMSAKSNLEISKIFSGLYPDRLDYERAIRHIEKAEKIDPDYCDVHWQLAQIYFRQNNYQPFEERLTKAVLCPFTMGGALPLFEQYWKIVTADPKTGQQAAVRHARHTKVIQDAVAKAKDAEIEGTSTTDTSNSQYFEHQVPPIASSEL